MYVEFITLKNFRSYENQTISFPKGSTLLMGDIGSGKSSILQAVEFALFGIMRGVTDASYFLRHGAKECEVSLTFTLDETITVTRTLSKTKNSVAQGPGTLTKAGVTQSFTPGELKVQILELLGYPSSASSKSHSLLYRYTVYASQEDMKSIILERPESRLNTLRILFGVDKYKSIVENASVILREKKMQKKSF
jgi:exonuclease SbcC